MKKTFIILAMLLVARNSVAQFNETIRTGRPGNAIGAFTVGHGIFQVQSGIDYFYSEHMEQDLSTSGWLNNTVMRLGLTEPFEISALLEYRTENVVNGDAETTQHGLSALDLGMRYHIFTGKGAAPNIGFQIRMRLPVLSEAYEIKDMAPRFIVVTSQRLGDTFTLITNWGASWNGNDSAPRGTYVINFSFPFTERVGAFVETYGGLQRGVFTSEFDTGLAWLLNDDLQFDLSAGYGSNHGVKNYFVSTGVSWRSRKK